MTRSRLDAALVSRGLARSRAQAGDLIRDGVVLVDAHVVGKPSRQVSDAAVITLTRKADRWVGRAALKLVRALELWPIAVAGRRCLDVGASTGGFTQVLLEHGASQVTALDVGHGQLVARLALDPRVIDLQGTNIRDVDAGSLGGPFDLVVCDLSFISLTVALPAIRPLVSDDGDGGDLVVLVKPQFEVGRERLGRSGVVTSRDERHRVLRSVHATATRMGLGVRAAAPSPIRGGEGNIEFLLWLAARDRTPAALSADDMLDSIGRQEENS
ncbi:MAG TPA: TlyA family RNA methyltransferase [Intrasporangium sp.]|uniref:TlyA family RNA methyltransferase n=1 Tax=Intrasporangium sp. TaxID=1925024 RepID=UPI002B4A92AE|nr:TlyA family RNA methyltransferase [Intrasporangium sp.]HKX67576.1 TlyA family RNA methyltransferase [Intrasporangium sp.]